MPARKREPGSWWSDPDASSASGGHVAPASSGPLFDPVEERPGGRDEAGAVAAERPDADGRERTDVIPRGNLAATELEGARGRYRASHPRPAARRVKRTLRHIDPLSVLKLSLFYYACFLVLWLAFVALAYGALASLGLFDAVAKVGRAFVLWDDVHITLWFVERWALLIGVTLVVIGSVLNLFLAFVYNLASDVVGGAELTFVERDL